MALTTVQKKQALRIPVVDASVTTADKFALLGLIQSETTASALTSVQKKQLLRIPVVDASISTSDKFAFLGLVESAGTGPTVFTFSLAWTIDTTISFNEPTIEVDGVFALRLGSFIGALRGTTLGAVPYPIDKIAASTASRHTGIAALHEMIGLSSVSQDSDVSVEGQLTSISVKTVSIDIAITPLGVKIQ